MIDRRTSLWPAGQVIAIHGEQHVIARVSRVVAPERIAQRSEMDTRGGHTSFAARTYAATKEGVE